MTSVDELRAVLQQDRGGGNLYDHLTNLLLRIAVERPSDAFEAFEHISAEVKETGGQQKSQQKVCQPQIDAQLAWASACATLLKIPDEPNEDVAKVQDLLDEANALAWAGVSFGPEETYRLYLSLKALAGTVSASHETLRFWGKIHTRNGYYYVVEGKTIDEIDTEGNAQEDQTGTNKYTYWVATSASSKWTKLPHVTAQQIKRARLIRKYFTGDLTADVAAYPPFPGREDALLRAQIARISAATCISPDGFFELDDESDPPSIKPAEAEAIAEKFPKSAEELMSADGWVHHELEINTLGRNAPLPPEQDEDGNDIEPEEPIEVVAPLRSIGEDTPEGKAWSFRMCPGGAGAGSTSVVVARSLHWPGAYAIAFGSRYLNVYVGDGIKYTETTYTPPLPGQIVSEWQPAEEEPQLQEHADITTDPTPPAPEEEEED